MRWMVRGVLVAVMLLSGTGCRTGSGQPTFPRESYLAVWAGDADRAHDDFLAIVDVDPRSKSYGQILYTLPVGSAGNEPHALNRLARSDGLAFGTGVATSRIFTFDLRNPSRARLVRVEEGEGAWGLRAPVAIIGLRSGSMFVACPDRAGHRGTARELFDAPGGLIELDSRGRDVGEHAAASKRARAFIVAPSDGAIVKQERLLVTSNHGHGYASSTTAPFMPGIVVQTWSLDTMAPRGLAVLEVGPRGDENLGPLAVRAMRGRRLVLVATHEGGALYATDSPQLPVPAFKLVYDFGADARPGGAAITPDDRFYVVALTGHDEVVSLDVRDPWRPRLADRLRLDATGVGDRASPSALTMSADGTRIAVANYTIDVPAFRRDGDRRVHLIDLDPVTGDLRLATGFADEFTGDPGVSFERMTWPHGASGPARPHGVLFVAPVSGDR